MTAVRTIALMSLLTMVIAPAVSAGPAVINGYVKYTRGEHLGYHSFHPYATRSLLTRCLDGKSTIAWETGIVPQNVTEDAVTFIWVAGHSSGTSAADATFHLTINGKEAVSFTTVKERRVPRWTVRGNDGVTLSFDSK